MAKMGDVGNAYNTVVWNLLENVHMEDREGSGWITIIQILVM
jgi:hypothetical protein